MKGKIRQDGTRIVYENPWLKVREDDVTFPNGYKSIFGVIEKPNFVAVLPLDKQGRIHMVSQYRYAIGLRTWEIPQGAWPNLSEASPLEVARGELKEETGFTAGRMELIGRLYQAPGLSTQSFHAYLATDLQQGDTEREITESDMDTSAFSMAEVRKMISDGELMDGTTLSVFGLLAMQGRLESLT